jgi:hypothetical protein
LRDERIARKADSLAGLLFIEPGKRDVGILFQRRLDGLAHRHRANFSKNSSSKSQQCSSEAEHEPIVGRLTEAMLGRPFGTCADPQGR